ncbi:MULTISPECIES: thiolase family protein [unclassified Oscillibacter]|uniref:thiolase family protein n=1 Tax=unclassified Oscillibacter TaxID=2629304 RepID=UPI0025EF03B2|nr:MULTISPECIES: thiolase family protein [unclassified Oscillibacter]
MKQLVITGAARSAVGGYLGSLKTVEAQDLGAAAIQAAAARGGISLEQVDEVIFGDVYGYTPNVARCAALMAGVPEETPAFTVDRQCASSLQAVQSACYEINAGEADVIIAGGVEIMSRMTYYLPPSSRYEPLRLGDKPLFDTFSHGVTIVQPQAKYPGTNMGITAENVAERYHITREEEDAFSVDSQRKMKEAQDAGRFKDEIFPFEVKQRKGSFVFDTDEHIKPDTTMESLSRLRPCFKDGGVVTAGNSSGMNDGASAVVIMTEEKAKELGVEPLVRIVGTSSAGVDPRYMGLGPVPAIRKLLKKTGLELADIDLFELNEAFAAQSLGCLKELGMDMGTELYSRVNVNGGAIAHGHALANSGTRILTTMIYELKRRSGRYGLASLCIGGGQGMAILVENCR